MTRSVLPVPGALRWGWRQLTSMRTALLLLMLLAVAAVPGSVLPQRHGDPGGLAAFLDEHPSAGPVLDRLGFFDVYASPWFSAIYLLLFVSLVGCLVPRSRRHLRELLAAPPPAPRRLDRLPVHRTAALDPGDPPDPTADHAPGPDTDHTADPDADHTPDPSVVLAAARAHLRGRRYRTRTGEGWVAAERGLLAETGNLTFHLALLALLVSVAASALVGWTGQALVVVGDGFANTLPMYDSFRPGTRVDATDLRPFSLTLDDLRVRFEERVPGRLGEPREFRADLTVRDSPEASPRRERLEVNHPVGVAGARVFLVGNGYAPVITVRDGEGEVVFSGAVPFLPMDAQYTSRGVVTVPDAAPRQLAFTGFLLPTAVFHPERGPISVFPEARSPRLVLTALAGDPGEDDLGLDDGVARSVYVLDDSRLTRLLGADGEPVRIQLAPGQSATLPEGTGTVTFDGLRRYAALDIRSDPTRSAVLVSALVMLAGLLPSLFVRRRRIWVRVAPGARSRTVVEVAGLARGEDTGLPHEVSRVLAAALAAGEAATPERVPREG